MSGDFGDPKAREYLNGKIVLIPGNYEREGKYEIPEDVVLGEGIYKLNGKYIFSHEPLKIKNQEGDKLFGHIHGRQKIKPWGGLDVGVDGHNYKPVSEEEAQFYLEAIKKVITMKKFFLKLKEIMGSPVIGYIILALFCIISGTFIVGGIFGFL